MVEDALPAPPLAEVRLASCWILSMLVLRLIVRFFLSVNWGCSRSLLLLAALYGTFFFLTVEKTFSFFFWSKLLLVVGFGGSFIGLKLGVEPTWLRGIA